MLEDQKRIVGTEESAYRKFVAALKAQAKAPTYSTSWKKDSQLGQAQEEFNQIALDSWTAYGYDTILQSIERDVADKEASEKFAQIFPDYIKARSKLAARIDQIKEAYKPILEFRKGVEIQKRKHLDKINAFLDALKHEHDVDIDKPPYESLKREASKIDAALLSLSAVPTGSNLVETFKKFALPKEACFGELAKLSEVETQLEILVKDNVDKKKIKQEFESLRAGRPARKFKSVDDGLRIIKENHKKYLEENMLTQLDSLSKGKIKGEKVKQIKTYAEALVVYGKKPTTQKYLTDAIAQLSTLAKLGGGALAALLGVGVGGATFLTSKTGFLTGMINPFAGVQNVLTGAASAGLGAGVGYITYQLWEKSNQGEAASDFEKFQEEMRNAGLDKKYDVEKLISDLRGQVRNLTRGRTNGLFDQSALKAVQDKITAAVLLENALKAAQNGRLDTSFLANEAYKIHAGEDLQGVIKKNLDNMGCNNLRGMFDDLALAPVKEL